MRTLDEYTANAKVPPWLRLFKILPFLRAKMSGQMLSFCCSATEKLYQVLNFTGEIGVYLLYALSPHDVNLEILITLALPRS